MAHFEIDQLVQSLHAVRREWRESQNRSQEPGGRELPSREAVAQALEQLKGALFPMRRARTTCGRKARTCTWATRSIWRCTR